MKNNNKSSKNVFLTNISATFRTVLIILKWKLSVKVKSHFFLNGECCAVTSFTLCTQLLFAQTSSHFFYDEIVVLYNVLTSVQLCRLNVCVFGNVCFQVTTIWNTCVWILLMYISGRLLLFAVCVWVWGGGGRRRRHNLLSDKQEGALVNFTQWQNFYNNNKYFMSKA